MHHSDRLVYERLHYRWGTRVAQKSAFILPIFNEGKPLIPMATIASGVSKNRAGYVVYNIDPPDGFQTSDWLQSLDISLRKYDGLTAREVLLCRVRPPDGFEERFERFISSLEGSQLDEEPEQEPRELEDIGSRSEPSGVLVTARTLAMHLVVGVMLAVTAFLCHKYP